MCRVDFQSKMARWERIHRAPLLTFISGSGLEKDLICVQDPHVNVCRVKTLSGCLDVFCFHRRLDSGLIVERSEGV